MKKKFELKECRWCGEKFMPKSKSNVYCNSVCSKAKMDYDKEIRKRARFHIFTRDQFRCVYCGRSSIEDYAPLVVDHIIPESEGGDSSVYNVVTSCFTCNALKSNGFLEESVYLRILERNKMFNINMSETRRAFIKKVLTKIKEESKGKDRK